MIEPARPPAAFMRSAAGQVWSAARLRHAWGLVTQARVLHQGMESLFRSGRIPFYLGFAGHEVAQVAAALALRPGSDWFYPYYRDAAFALAAGHSLEDLLMSLMGSMDDPSAGGRQGPNHWGSRELRVVAQSSCAGTQFLQVVGVAEALAREGRGALAYVSTGEGAASQGELYEALNWAALRSLPVIFFVQDNGFAITTPASQQTAGSVAQTFGGMAGLAVSEVDGLDLLATFDAMSAAAARARTGQGPSLVHARVLRLCSHSSADDHKSYRDPRDLADERARDPVPRLERSLIEAGVLTGEEASALRDQARARLDRAVAYASAVPAPSPASVATHVYGAAHVAGDAASGSLAEMAPVSSAAAGSAAVDSADMASAPAEGAAVRLIDAIRDAMDEEMARDPRVVIFGEDVASARGGVFGATRGLIDRYGPGRVFNTPLAEASIVGVATGMATAGWRPIIEIQFADYIFPAMMQIRNELAMLRYRSRGEWTCPVVIRAPAGGYVGGGHYHSQSIEAFFTHIPGLRVVYPSRADDAAGLLRAAVRGDDPVLFLEHKALYRERRAARPPRHAILPFGQAAVLRPGADLSILTYGALVYRALDAAGLLERDHGISAEVVDLRTLSPLDIDTLAASARRTRRVIVAHEATLTSGFGAEIAACLAERCLTELLAPIRRVAALDTPVPFAPALEERMLPQTHDLVQAARALMQGGPPGGP